MELGSPDMGLDSSGHATGISGHGTGLSGHGTGLSGHATGLSGHGTGISGHGTGLLRTWNWTLFTEDSNWTWRGESVGVIWAAP